MPQPTTITGAMLVCNQGTAFTPLVATGDGKVMLCGAFTGVVTDITPGANILPFGICRITTGPCAPAPVGKWANPFPSCLIGNVESLLMGATLPCGVGGTILVTTAGQAQLVVDVNRRAYEESLGPDLVAEDLLAMGVDPNELFGGAAIQIEDGGSFYDRWSGIDGAHPTIMSSHKWSDQMRLRGSDGSGILFGRDADGNTMIQLEGHNVAESPIKGAPPITSTSAQDWKDYAGHAADFLTYKADDIRRDIDLDPRGGVSLPVSVDLNPFDGGVGVSVKNPLDGDAPNRGPSGTSTHNDSNPIVVDPDDD